MPEHDAVEVEGLSFSYASPPVAALRGVEFALPRGAFCAIIGPNASGKTTLIKLMMGLLKPEAGAVRIFGRDAWREAALIQRLIGYVPQREAINVVVPLRVRDVVRLAASTRLGTNGGKHSVMGRVAEAIEMVGMADQMRRPYRALSGGQQQRVLIARALAVDPHVLVLDEPFSGVDAASQETILEVLHHISQQHRVTVVAVVHNINPLVHFVDHVLLLQTEQVAFGEPTEVLTAENLQSAYGAVVPILVCDEGYRHPLVGGAAHE